jgi:hypothetical protein
MTWVINMSYEEPGNLSIRFQNEVAFCEVNNIELKNNIERIFMKNQIAFSEDWCGKLFSKSTRCIIRINSLMAEPARELLDRSGLDLSQVNFLEVKRGNIQLER